MSEEIKQPVKLGRPKMDGTFRMLSFRVRIETLCKIKIIAGDDKSMSEVCRSLIELGLKTAEEQGEVK